MLAVTLISPFLVCLLLLEVPLSSNAARATARDLSRATARDRTKGATARDQSRSLDHGDFGGIVANRCSKCDPSRCPQLSYCEGRPIKDSCGCCTICSAVKFQPHITDTTDEGEDACKQVDCPSFKVCIVNFQGLPLCQCPSQFVCRRSKQKEICGSDGHTYSSRCMMRISACNKRVQIWKEHRGACSPDEKPMDAATYRRKFKRLKRRRRKRRQRKKEKMEARGESEDEYQRKKKNRKRKRRKIGNRRRSRSRTRRHRKTKNKSSRLEKLLLENNFGRGTWN